MAVLDQQWRDEVPVPGAVARSVDQDVRGHDWYLPSVLLSQSLTLGFREADVPRPVAALSFSIA